MVRNPTQESSGVPMEEQARPWLRHYESAVPHTLEYPSWTVPQILSEAARKFPHTSALVFMGARLTYAQLSATVDRFAAALQDMGVKKGDRVAIYLPNSPQFLISYFGTLRAGAVVVPTNPLYVEREVEHQLKDAGAETIITLTRFYPLVRSLRPRTSLRNVIVTNIKEYFPPLLRLLFTLFREKKEGHQVKIEKSAGTYLFHDLMVRAWPAPSKVDVEPDDVALLQYTGGTTGVPKGAMLTHRNLIANTMQVSAWFTRWEPGREVILGALPFFHVYGMTVAMLLSVYWGATNVILPRFELSQVLKAINKYRPTVFPGVPTMYIAVNNAPDISRYDLRSIKACISGAAPLPVEVQQKFEQITGGRLVEGYGLTEAAPVTHCNPIFGLRKAGSIGIPLPDVDAKIVDLETGERELPVGEIGELIVRGPQVMKGYWNMPEETAQVLRGGWLFTGDIARRDEDGYFYIVDRKKDMIDAGGFKVYPRDVEEVLYRHPKIKEAVAVGVPDRYRGETVKVFIVLKEGQTATADEIIEYCRANLAKYKVPTAVEFRDALPKTMVGKFLRRVLQEEEKRKQAGTA